MRNIDIILPAVPGFPSKPGMFCVVEAQETDDVNQFRPLLLPIISMMIVVVASNILVQYPINDWLTYGALTYPAAFFVTDLTNRTLGAKAARRVVPAGFILAVLLSIYLATPRIALASGAAFMVAQLMDISVFNRLRERSWWQAPLASSFLGSAIDTAIFFSIAFYGSGLPWTTWAYGDFSVKIGMALLILAPYGGIVRSRWVRA